MADHLSGAELTPPRLRPVFMFFSVCTAVSITSAILDLKAHEVSSPPRGGLSWLASRIPPDRSLSRLVLAPLLGTLLVQYYVSRLWAETIQQLSRGAWEPYCHLLAVIALLQSWQIYNSYNSSEALSPVTAGLTLMGCAGNTCSNGESMADSQWLLDTQEVVGCRYTALLQEKKGQCLLQAPGSGLFKINHKGSKKYMEIRLTGKNTQDGDFQTEIKDLFTT